MQEDVRLDEAQIAQIEMLVAGGMDEREAKLRVMCIGVAPDHFKPVPAKGGLYPRAVYHKDGRIKTAANEKEFAAATKAGWEDHASEVHVEKILLDEQRRQTLPVGAALTKA